MRLPSANRALITTPINRSSSRHIIQESSLLSFPILSSYGSPSSSSSASHSALSAYSSMPLSSFTVSGRRSFGGANAEIERLNNPNAAEQQDGAEGAAARDKETASQRKKRKAAEREGATVTGRRMNVNTPRGAGVGAAAAGRSREEEGSAGKKQKFAGSGSGREAGGGFAKPGGFEGARTLGGRGKTIKTDVASDFDADASFDEAALDLSESSAEGDSDGEVDAFLRSALAPSTARERAVAAAEGGFVEDEEKPAKAAGAAGGDAGLTKNQKRKLALKRAKEEADKRKGKKGGP